MINKVLLNYYYTFNAICICHCNVNKGASFSSVIAILSLIYWNVVAI